MKDYRHLLELMNKEPLTDRDVGLGIGMDRIKYWESLGDKMFPFDKQVEVLMSPAKEIYICASRGSGKSQLATIRAVEELCMPNRKIFLLAPYYRLCKIVFQNVMLAFKKSPFLKSMLKGGVTFNRQEMSIRTDIGTEGSELVCMSADNPDALIGQEADLLIIDEAAVISNDAFRLVYPALARKARFGRMFAISTPRDGNFFGERFHDTEDPRFAQFRLHILDNPYADHSLYYAEKEAAERVGSPYAIAMFEREFEAKFDTITGDVFSFTNDIWFPENFYAPTASETIVIGIDYARLHDYTVCTAFTPSHKMVGFDRFNKLDDHSMIDRMVDFIAKFHNGTRSVRAYVDATGEGSGVPTAITDRLRLKYGISSVIVEGVKFSSGNKEQFVETLKVKLSEERLALWNVIDDRGKEVIKNELRSYIAEETPGGRIKFGARPGTHDDIVMSMCLAVAHLEDGMISVH